MSQSTKISDLPDNTSSKILNDLKNEDNDSIISETDEIEEDDNNLNYSLKKTKKSKILTTQNIAVLYDACIIFVLVFVMTNKYSLSVISKIPYLTNYAPHSMIYNIIIALIVSIIYIAIKFLTMYYDKF